MYTPSKNVTVTYTSTEGDFYVAVICEYCGQSHGGQCPRVKSIEYHENGKVKRVEFFEMTEAVPPIVTVSGGTQKAEWKWTVDTVLL